MHQTLTETGGSPLTAASTAEGVISPHGVIGGGQLGYNWQGDANWLAGFEADFQGSNQSDTTCTPLICATVAGVGSQAITIEQELQFLATLRGRIGAVSNGVLVYATGGAAFGRVAETVSLDFSGAGGLLTSSATTSDQVGWVVGGGMEVALWGGWSAKAEYLYVDLGSLSNTVSGETPPVGLGGPTTNTIVTTSTIRDHIFRMGANYRFGATPVVSRAY